MSKSWVSRDSDVRMFTIVSALLSLLERHHVILVRQLSWFVFSFLGCHSDLLKRICPFALKLPSIDKAAFFRPIERCHVQVIIEPDRFPHSSEGKKSSAAYEPLCIPALMRSNINDFHFIMQLSLQSFLTLQDTWALQVSGLFDVLQPW